MATVPTTGLLPEQGEDIIPSQPSMLADAIQQTKDRQRNDFMSTLEVVGEVNPDEFAKATAVSKYSGIPAEVLHSQQDQMEKLLKNNRYAAVYDSFPKTAAALSNGQTAALAQDDIDNLTRIEYAKQITKFDNQSTGEKLFGAVEQAVTQGKQAAGIGYADRLERLRRSFDSIDQEITRAALVNENPYPNGDNPTGFGFDYMQQTPEGRLEMRERLLGRQAETISDVVSRQEDLDKMPVEPGALRYQELGGDTSAMAQAIAENPGYAARAAAGSAVSSAEMLVAGALGGPLAAGVVEFGTEGNAKLLDVLREAKIDLTNPKAVLTALQDDALMDDARVRAARKAAGTTAVDVLGMGLAGRLLVPKAIGGKALTGTQREVTNLAVQFPVQGVIGGASEAAGQYAADQKVSGGDVFMEAVAGAGMSSIEVATFGGGRIIDTIKDGLAQSRQARQGKATLDEMVAASLDSKLRTRDAEAFNGVATEQLKDSPMEMITIPAEALAKLNQDGAPPVLDALLERIPGLSEQFAEATASGGSVSMKTADYLTAFAEHHAALANSIRTQVDGMSVEETAQWQAAQEEQINELAKTLERGPDTRDDAFIGMMGELQQAGYRRADAEQYAALHLSSMSTLADRTGKPLQELLERFPLDVRNKAPDAIQRVSVDDMRLAIGRLRTGDIPQSRDMFGKSLVEYLRDAGGLNDEGGELAALDVNVGKVGRNRLVKADGGLSLDDAAMRAWENGYFPGVAREDVGPQLIVDAVQRDMNDQPTFSSEQENGTLRDQATNLQQLQDYLDQLGVNLNELSDDQVLAILRDPESIQGVQLDQAITREQLSEKLRSEVPGLKLDLMGNGSTVTLSRIVIPEGNRSAGSGSRVMQEIVDWADANGKKIALTPSADFGGNKKRLGDFYRRFGFVDNKGKNKDFEVSESMVREPRLNQTGAPREPRGYITFNDGKPGEQRKFQITVTARRDLSTLLHEFGHFYLEVVTDLATDADAPLQMKQDVEAIREWTGAKPDGPFEVEQHEQFARGFEAYLAEGKTPNPELQGAFARFKRWIIAIYKDLTRLNVQLSDEIRGVMDRIVATDDQIRAAQDVTQAIPMFESAAKAGMTETEFAAYRDQVDLAHAEAATTVEQQVIREEEQRRSKWWGEESARIAAEVSEELDTLPEYQAIRALRKGIMPDGTQQNIKLQGSEIKELYGTAVLRNLAFMHGKDGIPMDIAAQILGFKSGDEMVKAILGAPPRGEAIRAETQARMMERHGARADGASTEKAMAAVHNEKRGAVLLKELNALGKQGNRKNITSQQVMKAAAERIMQNRKVRDIHPFEYQRAEGTAGRRAFEAAAKGDLAAAYEAKQQQLLNYHLWREAKKAREEIDSIVNRMADFNKSTRREKLGKAGHSYLDQIDAVMEQYEFRSVSLRDLDKRVSFAQWYADQLAQGNEPDVPEFILNTSQKVNYKDLSLAQLSELNDFVQNVNHLAGLKNKLLANKRLKDFAEAKDLLVKAAYANLGKRKAPPIDKGILTALERMGDWAGSMSAALLKMEQIVQWLDDGDIEGPWHTTFWQPFVEAQAAKDDLNREFTTQLMANVDKYIAARGQKAMREQINIPEIGQALTRNAIISAALNTGNAGNREKLLKGYGWDENQLGAILRNMNKDDWEFAQSQWDLVERLWPQIEQLEKDLHGVAPDKIVATPVSTQYGEYSGGYWPLVYDTSSPEYAQVANNLTDNTGLFEQGYAKATTPKGHTKARVDSFAAPIMLDTSIVASHLGQVIHDLTHRKAIIDAAKIISNKEVKQALNETLGVNIANQFNPWLQGVANDMVMDSRKGIDAWTNLSSTLRANLSVGWMGFSATTGIQQILGFSQSWEHLAQLGARKYLPQGMLEFVRQPFKTIEFVKSLSGEMRNRDANLDNNMREVLKRISGKTGPKEVIQRLAFKHISVIQSLVDYPTWLAAYHKGMADGETLDTSVAMGDRAVRLSQMAGGPKDLAAVQRKDGLMKALTIVYSYFNLLYNRQADLVHSMKTAQGVKDYLQAFERTMFLIALPAVLAPLMTGQGPKDDESYSKWAALKIATYPLMAVPLIRDVGSSLESGWAYSGATPIGDVFKSTTRLASAVGQDEIDAEKITMSTMDVIGMGFGLPTAQPKRTAKYLFSVERGERQDDNMLEFIRGLMFGPPKEHK
jgi:GNAT superfamily N-acetyltransferase